MGVQYLVDYENVHETGIIGLEELSPEDNVYIFHTNMTEKIRLSILDYVQAWVKVILVPPGNQSLDMHLGSFLGYLIGKEEDPETQYVIISHDTDYCGIARFWNRTFSRTKVQCSNGITQPVRSVKDEIELLIPQGTDEERIAIRDYIVRAFMRNGSVDPSGQLCMRVSELCALLNGLPEYNKARARTGKKPLQFLNEECQDIIWTHRRWQEDWVYLNATQAEKNSAAGREPEKAETGAGENRTESEGACIPDTGDTAVISEEAQAEVEESQAESDEPDILELGDLTIDDEALTAEEVKENCEETDLPGQEEAESAETDFLAAAMECLRQAGEAEKNARGDVRASWLRDQMLKIPAFQILQKESGQKPIPFLQEKFAGKIRFFREKNIWWASAEDAPEEAAGKAERPELAKRKKTYYEKALANIEKRLTDAGMEHAAAEEIANICMHSNTAVEPRKVIHQLLCHRFGSKIGGQYYKKAIKYAGM